MDNLISRQAAIDVVRHAWAKGLEPTQYLEELPSAQKKGKWIEQEDPFGFFDTIPVCSECGCTTKMRERYNYCPNCGADMREDCKL